MKEGAVMFHLRKWVWVAALAATAGATVPSAAQTGGVTSGGATATGGSVGVNGGGGGGLGGGGGGGGGLGSIGSTSTGLGGGSGGNGSSGAYSIPTLSIPGLTTSSSSLQKSNVFSSYYANPMAFSTSTSPSTSFGSALYGTSSTGSRTTAGRGGLGSGSQSSTANQSGIVIPIQSQMNYSAVMRFDAPPAAVSAVQTQIRGAIDATSELSNPRGVEVAIDGNNNVTLRGTVKNREEVRLVEGLVRLTPGVRAIKNELQPAQLSAGP
jgi:hypothetical protein